MIWFGYSTGITKPHEIIVNTFFVSVSVSFFMFPCSTMACVYSLPRCYLNGQRWIHLITSLNYVIELKKQRSNKSKVVSKENLSHQIHLDSTFMPFESNWGWRKAKTPEKKKKTSLRAVFWPILILFQTFVLTKNGPLGVNLPLRSFSAKLFDRGTTFIWSKSKTSWSLLIIHIPWVDYTNRNIFPNLHI